jgi:hypothetical protein
MTGVTVAEDVFAIADMVGQYLAPILHPPPYDTVGPSAMMAQPAHIDIHACCVVLCCVVLCYVMLCCAHSHRHSRQERRHITLAAELKDARYIIMQQRGYNAAQRSTAQRRAVRTQTEARARWPEVPPLLPLPPAPHRAPGTRADLWHIIYYTPHTHGVQHKT